MTIVYNQRIYLLQIINQAVLLLTKQIPLLECILTGVFIDVLALNRALYQILVRFLIMLKSQIILDISIDVTSVNL